MNTEKDKTMGSFQNELNVTLKEAWEKRRELYVEGDKLHTEGHKLYTEGYKLYAEGHNLYAKGSKLHTEGNLIWDNAVLKMCGNIDIKWDGDKCILSTTQVFE